MEDAGLEDSTLKNVLTIREVALRLRCSEAHISNRINVRVEGVPTLTHMAIGRRKRVRREWLDRWMNVLVYVGPPEAEQPPCDQVSGIPEMISRFEANFRVHDDLRQGQ
jgi:hypothetical protein